jgi:pimeloyl-ACP methyl ester carboxylesterase
MRGCAVAAFAEAFPPQGPSVLDRTGHMLMLERPDAFNTEPAHFLDHLSSE